MIMIIIIKITICFDNSNCSSNNNTHLFRDKSVKNIKKLENMIAS